MDQLFAHDAVHAAYHYIENFEWQENVTPLSNMWIMLGLVVAYQLLIRAMRAVIKKPVYVPTVLPALHNLLLSAVSLIMFLGCLYETIQETQRRGSGRWLVCAEAGQKPKGPVFFWSYMYYLSKYWEFVDTIFLALKAKDITFLHFMHHTLVAPMCWVWLQSAQSMQQIGIMWNCAVHVIMYFYYFLCTLKIYPKWKQLITWSQIVQFMTSLSTFWVFCVMHLTAEEPSQGCAGFKAAVGTSFFHVALLYLFVDFNMRTYSKKKAAGKRE